MHYLTVIRPCMPLRSVCRGSAVLDADVNAHKVHKYLGSKEEAAFQRLGPILTPVFSRNNFRNECPCSLQAKPRCEVEKSSHAGKREAS